MGSRNKEDEEDYVRIEIRALQDEIRFLGAIERARRKIGSKNAGTHLEEIQQLQEQLRIAKYS